MKLKEKRLNKGMSIRRLALISGVNKATIIGIESGKHIPREYTLARLAIALGCKMEEIQDEI